MRIADLRFRVKAAGPAPTAPAALDTTKTWSRASSVQDVAWGRLGRCIVCLEAGGSLKGGKGAREVWREEEEERKGESVAERARM
eukprot:3754340-Rhodomonas_salina.1